LHNVLHYDFANKFNSANEVLTLFFLKIISKNFKLTNRLFLFMCRMFAYVGESQKDIESLFNSLKASSKNDVLTRDTMFTETGGDT
jgi:hypothetical protein